MVSVVWCGVVWFDMRRGMTSRVGVGAVAAAAGRGGRTATYTALMSRNYPIAAYNMVAARLTDLRAADSTQVPFKK